MGTLKIVFTLWFTCTLLYCHIPNICVLCSSVSSFSVKAVRLLISLLTRTRTVVVATKYAGYFYCDSYDEILVIASFLLWCFMLQLKQGQYWRWSHLKVKVKFRLYMLFSSIQATIFQLSIACEQTLELLKYSANGGTWNKRDISKSVGKIWIEQCVMNPNLCNLIEFFFRFVLKSSSMCLCMQ